MMLSRQARRVVAVAVAVTLLVGALGVLDLARRLTGRSEIAASLAGLGGLLLGQAVLLRHVVHGAAWARHIGLAMMIAGIVALAAAGIVLMNG